MAGSSGPVPTVNDNVPSTDLSSESESDSEAEWRASIRAALEEDLQRKVRLRLGSLVHKWRGPQGVKSLSDLRPLLINNRSLQRPRFQELLQEAESPREKSGRLCSDSAISDKNESEQKSGDQRAMGMKTRSHLARGCIPPAVERSNGVVLRCSQVDHRLRWPLELKIVHPTPQHRDGAEPYVHGGGTEVERREDGAEPYVHGGGTEVKRREDGAEPYGHWGGTEVERREDERREDGAEPYVHGGGTEVEQPDDEKPDGTDVDHEATSGVETTVDASNGNTSTPIVTAPDSRTCISKPPEHGDPSLDAATGDGLVPPSSEERLDVVAALSAAHVERQSDVTGDHLTSSGITVYDYSNERPVQTCESRTLMFESRFESGNLYKATQVSQYQFNLLLRTDLYTDRHTQWYYFKVSNMEAGVLYTFSITNLMKRESLYQEGMKPLLYSEKEAASGRCGWSRVGYHISYKPTEPLVDPESGERQYYTLTWEMEFPWSGDQCYLSHCYPYPYSKLLSYLDGLGTSHEKKKFVKREVLCHTLAGNVCPVLTITDFNASEQQMVGRKGVVISARVHPGETNGSWMMQGVMDVLTSNTKLARSLRSNFIFKLVPMLNPDGVVAGNYRTSLAGLDLNRVYRKPSQDLCPTVWSIKKMIEEMMEEREVLFYVDLHGHSHKQNIFNYGCHDHDCDHTQFLNERVFCFLLSQLASDKFSFPSCKFSVRKSKRKTGRVVVWKMGVANSYTMEASFCGSTLRPQAAGQVDHFTTEDLVSMGRSLCEAIQKYHHFDSSPSYQCDVLAMLAEQLMIQCEGSSGEEEVATPTLPVEPLHLPPLTTTPPTTVARGARRHHRTRSSAVLKRFMKVDLKLLGRESSTSGSGSDSGQLSKHAHSKNKRKKNKRRRRRKKEIHSAGHLGVGPQGMLHLPHPVHLGSIKQFKPGGPQATLVNKTEKSKYQPTTLGSKFEVPPTRTRFINRYANRSNGGIPMFAEERLRERQKKEKLLLSQNTKPSSSEPLISSTLTGHTVSTFSTFPTTHLVPSSIPLLWKPIDTPEDERGYNPVIDRVNQHYQRVRDLVEGHQLELNLVSKHQIDALKPRSSSEGDLKATPTSAEHLRATHWMTSHVLQHRYRPAAGQRDHTPTTSYNLADYLDRVWRS